MDNTVDVGIIDYEGDRFISLEELIGWLKSAHATNDTLPRQHFDTVKERISYKAGMNIALSLILEQLEELRNVE